MNHLFLGGVMADLNELRKMVKKAIDDGATNLEQIHKFVAELPFEYLMKVQGFEEKAKSARDFSKETIGKVYTFIRDMNSKVDEIAGDLLAKAQK